MHLKFLGVFLKLPLIKTFIFMPSDMHKNFSSLRYCLLRAITVHTKTTERPRRTPPNWTTASIYRISANSFRGNYSLLEVGVRQVFKGGNYCFILLFVKDKKINRYCFISCKLDQAN